MTNQNVLIGSLTVTNEEARRLIQGYVTAGEDGGLFAWPSYDALVTNERPELVEADLLAPALLNAAVGIRSFSELKQRLPALNEALAGLDVDAHLADGTDETLRAIGACYAILDDRRPYGVRGTTLAKILHRKCPRLVPLYDQLVFACYAGRLPIEPDRPWSTYLTLLAAEVQSDLHSFDWPRLIDRVKVAGGLELTPVRALDILARRVASQDSLRGAAETR